MPWNIIDFINSNRDILDSVMDLVPIPLFIKDISGKYITCNKAFECFLGIRRDQIIGKTAYDLCNKREADIFSAQDAELFQRGGLQIYETLVTNSKSITSIIQFHKQTFTDDSGAVAGFLGALFDITEKKALESALQKIAATDDLTGLPNRRDGMVRFNILHNDSKRKNRPYCVAMIDIDNFKKLNDQYGHANGDLVLKAFSDLTTRTLRCSDVCFRYGGEEFILLLPETARETGYKIVERLRKTWAEMPLLLPGFPSVRATISIGLAQYPSDGNSLDHLIQASDRALYGAKNGGRNRTVRA